MDGMSLNLLSDSDLDNIGLNLSDKLKLKGLIVSLKDSNQSNKNENSIVTNLTPQKKVYFLNKLRFKLILFYFFSFLA